MDPPDLGFFAFGKVMPEIGRDVIGS